jgi:hypothetical protein
MNCPRCEAAIEEADPKMAMPCCSAQYHSTCALQVLANSPYWYRVRCVCGTLLIGEEDPVPAPIPDTDEYRADMRKYSEVLKELRKAKRTMNGYATQAKREFKERTQLHVDALKAIKKEEAKAFSAAPQVKEYTSKLRKYSLFKTKLTAKHGTTIRDREFGRYRVLPRSIIYRTFRIRI